MRVLGRVFPPLREWLSGNGKNSHVLKAALVCGCTSIALLSAGPSAASEYRPGSGDEFIVVDCLLPGQVRRLGNRVYQSRRRPVMATAKECHVRGGEYVLDDRASISGSIQAWLPMAMDGDVHAQNYVGELAERGPNGQADFAMARLWYQRAADQGNNEARFNLARMYENGLGGDPEPEKAAELYRLAYGFDGELATQVRLVDPAELVALRSQIAERDATIVEREAEITRLQVRIATLEDQSAALQVARDAALAEVAGLQSALAEQRRALSSELTQQADAMAASTEEYGAIDAARAELEQRQAALTGAEQRLAMREAALAERIAVVTAETGAGTVEIARLTSALDAARAQLASLESDRDLAFAERDEALSSLVAMKTDLDQQLRALSQREADLAGREQAAQAQVDAGSALTVERAALSEARRQLTADMAQYEQARRALEVRTEAAAAKEADLARQRLDITAVQRDLDARAASVAGAAGAREALANERAAFEAERASFESAQATFATRLQAADAREQSLLRRMSELEQRATTMTLREEEINKREREAIEARQSADAALSQLATLKSQIELAQQTLSGGQRSLVPGAQTLTPEPIRDSFQVEFGTYHALLIGNQNYDNPDWPDLDTSHNDVVAIGKILREKYGFKTTVLKDATRFDILKALSDLGDELGEGDNLLLYFAGHGQYIDQVSSGYWEPVDSIPYKTVNSISVQDVNTQLSLTQARKVLVVSDSCYSGAFTRAPYAMINGDAGHEAREKYLRQIASKRSRTVMTAGGLQPVADGLGNGHSLFARAFISALVDNDDVALGRDVFSRVRDVVTVSATAMNWEQEPEYDEIVHSGHEGGDFIFVPVAP